MSTLKLSVQHRDEISLPVSVMASSLSLAEVGTLASIACLEHQPEDEKLVDGLFERFRSPEVHAAIQSLREKGVLTSSGESTNTIRVEVDLDALPT